MWISRKKYLEDQKKIRDLNNKLKIEKEILNKTDTKKNPQNVIEDILGKNLEWFDYLELAPSERSKYILEAQQILSTTVFENEINYLFTSWMKWCLEQSKNFEDIRDIRMNYVGIDLFRKRLKSIIEPVNEAKITEDIDGIYSPI